MATDINSVSTAQDGLPVTPSNTVDLPAGCRGLLVAVGGTLQIDTISASTGVRITRALTVPAGVVPIQALRVWSTNTTASGITALY